MSPLRTPDPHPTARPDDVSAVHGARWVTVASLTVGALNYGYALLLTRLLDVHAYAIFAAGQGLLLCAATVALVAIPWVLAQALTRASSQEARGDAVRFGVVIAVIGGVLAGGAVAAVAAQFAGAVTVAVLGGTTLLIYVTRVSVGWLQGTERMQTLACVVVSEGALKFVVGLLLVSALGLGATGALAAFTIAVAPFLIWWPYRMAGGRGRWVHARANRDLWRRALELGTVQSLVAIMATVDVVLVTLLPTEGSATASYQASVMVSRAPLFLAGAISLAFFPALSRRRMGTPLAANAMRMYLIVALPLTAVVATTPDAVLDVAFPAEYEMMSMLVMFTAVAGFAIGGINLVSTFFQAVNDQSCVRRQAAGVVLFVAALLAGWRAGGVLGLAIGGSCGALAALLLLVHLLVRRQGFSVFAHLPLLEPLLVACVLVALRPVPLVWLIAATATGILATVRFLRHRAVAPAAEERAHAGQAHQDTGTQPAPGGRAPGQDRPRHEDGPPHGLPLADGHPEGGGDPVRLLLDAVWHHRIRPAGDEELRRALAAARRNQVEGLLAHAYPQQLAETVAEVKAYTALFRRNLCESAGRLRKAGIPSILIKAELSRDYVYDNFDLVVPEGQWRAADRALSDWYVHRERYWLERSTKVLLWPPRGPATHLHVSVSWFGIPVLPNDRLFARALPVDGRPWLEPAPADRLRIYLAHGLFQNLSLDLSELLAIRPLLRPDVMAEAGRAAAQEGWATAHRRALKAVTEAVGRLDRGEVITLPVPLPLTVSLQVAAEHARHLMRKGNTAVAAREAALRVPLVVTKRRKMENS